MIGQIRSESGKISPLNLPHHDPILNFEDIPGAISRAINAMSGAHFLIRDCQILGENLPTPAPHSAPRPNPLEIFSVRQCSVRFSGSRKSRNDKILLLDIASPIIISAGEIIYNIVSEEKSPLCVSRHLTQSREQVAGPVSLRGVKSRGMRESNLTGLWSNRWRLLRCASNDKAGSLLSR